MRPTPRNERAEAARAAMRDYNAPLLVVPVHDDDAFKAAVFAKWPAMLPYAATAIIETVYYAKEDVWRRIVTVTIF